MYKESCDCLISTCPQGQQASGAFSIIVLFEGGQKNYDDRSQEKAEIFYKNIQNMQ